MTRDDLPTYGPPENDDERFFCRFTFGQFFAILLMEVFTLFFVFYLGARYGRSFLGLENERVVIAGPESREAKTPTTADPEVAAMARDLIAKAKTPELKERIAAMLKTESRPAEEVPAPAPPPTPTPPPRDSAANEAPAALVSEGVVRVKSGEAARYALQIGSYPELAQANESVERWKGKGYSAYMMIADIPDRGRWYRVRIGGFASRTDAEAYLHEFADREHVDALVVLNEQ